MPEAQTAARRAGLRPAPYTDRYVQANGLRFHLLEPIHDGALQSLGVSLGGGVSNHQVVW